MLLCSMLLGALACGGGGTPISVALELSTPDAFQAVSFVRLEVSGPGMQTMSAEVKRSASEIRLPPVPFGPERRISVQGLDSDRFVVSRGESIPFEVSAAGPERVTVPFGRCGQNLARDEDGDEFGAAGPSRVGCVQPGWTVRSNDCDDRDAEAHPGQAEFFERPTRGTARYDFNCDGQEEPQSSDLLPDCASAAPCKGEGWVGSVPACGAPGEFGVCEKKVPDCVATTRQKIQSCR